MNTPNHSDARFFANENVNHPSEVIANLSRAYLALARSHTEQKLDKPAMVGNTRFGVNVAWATVIDRAIREYEYQVTPEKEAERMKRVRQFVDAAAGTAVVPPYSDITPQDSAPSTRGEKE